jgi:hypothetical protein
MRKQLTSDPFQSIDGAALSTVVGGRITPRKGTDPAVIQGIQSLVQVIAQVGQQMSASKQAGSQQMMQMMQQMMQARGGR